MNLRTIAALMALAALAACSGTHKHLSGQDAAAIGPGYVYGYVRDPAGNILSTGIVQCPTIIITNTSGSYKGKFYSDATYTLTASAPGYVSQTVSLTMRVGTTNPYDFHLALATVAN